MAAALEHMEATASALFVGKILKEETALKLEAGTKRIQAPPCFRDYFNLGLTFPVHTVTDPDTILQLCT